MPITAGRPLRNPVATNVVLVVSVTACAAVVWALFVRTVAPVDLDVFLRAAHTVVHGASPYVNNSSARLWSGQAFVYPYFAAWCFAPLSAMPAAAAGLVYYLLSVTALVVAVRLLNVSPSPFVVCSALLAEPVVRGLQLGTVNAWLLVGLALAWRYRNRSAVVVGALTVLIVVKLFLLPMVVWLLVTRRWKAAAATLACSAAAIALGCRIVHLRVADFGRMLTTLSAHEGPHSSSVAAILSRLGAGHATVVAGPLVLASVVVAVGLVIRRRSGSETPVFLACVLASIAASPIVWSHYYTLLLVVPLMMQWPARVHVLTAASTWLLGIPTGGAVLAVIHPFPLAGWMWVLLLVGAVLVGRRFGSVALPGHPEESGRSAGLRSGGVQPVGRNLER